MTPLDALAAALAGLDITSGGEALRETTRRRVFDTLGALAVGLSTDEGLALRHLARMAPDNGSVAGLISLAVGATRSTEIDDIHIGSCVTAGSVVVPVAAVLAKACGADDDGFLAAVVAGYEAIVRLGTAIDGARALYRGVWPTYVAAPFAAAAVGSRMLALDAARTADALALALARTSTINPGRPAHGVSGRSLSLGSAAAEGAAAAMAAAAGFGGDPATLDRLGQAIALRQEALADDLGRAWAIDAVDIKPFPTARQGMAAVAAFLARPQPADELAAVEVRVPAPCRAMIAARGMPENRVASLISVSYQLALAALAPDRLYDARRAALPAGDDIDAFMSKVEVREDDALTAQFPERWGATLRLRRRSGESIETTILEPPGAAKAAPLDWEALSAKQARILAASGLAGEMPPDRLRKICQGLGKKSSEAGAARLVDAALAIGG